MMDKRKTRLAASLLALSALTAGCGGGGGGAGGTTGTLTLGLTDAPVTGAAHVMVAFSGVQLKPSDGPAMDPVALDQSACDNYDAATGLCYIDLLSLTGNTRKVVFSAALPAGSYDWVRLQVAADRNVLDSYISFDDGSQCPLWIPSGSQTGLKIVSGITVTANGESDYTLDFNVRKSVTRPLGLAGADPNVTACQDNYILKPAIRIVDNTQVGTVSGTVDEALLQADDKCMLDNLGVYQNVAVYVFDNSSGNFVADDIDGDDSDGTDPITSANVTWDGASSSYRYEVGYLLAPADYGLALTCTADLDTIPTDDSQVQPEANDYDPSSTAAQDFGFVADMAVSVTADQTTTADFAAAP